MASAKRRKEKIIRRKLLKSDILKVLRGQQIISWKGEKTGKRKTRQAKERTKDRRLNNRQAFRRTNNRKKKQTEHGTL